MAKSSTYKLSLLGLILIAASAVTAAILPKEGSKRSFNGVQQPSTAAGVSGQKTCVNASGIRNCTVTDNSGTSVGGDTSTGATNTGGTATGFNSSQSPN